MALTSAQSGFMTQIYNTARSLGASPVLAKLAASQAALESNYGKSAPGGNYFGIKSTNGAGNSLPTQEVVNGQSVTMQQTFAAPGSMQASVQSYLSLIQRNYPLTANATTIEQAAQGLNFAKSGGSYATAPNYSGIVTGIANGFTPVDSGVASAPVVDNSSINGTLSVDPGNVAAPDTSSYQIGGSSGAPLTSDPTLTQTNDYTLGSNSGLGAQLPTDASGNLPTSPSGDIATATDPLTASTGTTAYTPSNAGTTPNATGTDVYNPQNVGSQGTGAVSGGGQPINITDISSAGTQAAQIQAAATNSLANATTAAANATDTTNTTNSLFSSNFLEGLFGQVSFVLLGVVLLIGAFILLYAERAPVAAQ